VIDKKYVYLFEEGSASLKKLLGGKGANLAEMTNLGLPVPPGFTITTEACNEYYSMGKEFPEGLEEGYMEAMKKLAEKLGRRFGDPASPLLVSVRSGAVISMPGMMDTVLNLGLNDETVQGLAEMVKDERFALESYRRFIQMFGNVVLGIDINRFEEVLEKHREEAGAEYDHEIGPESLKPLIEEYKGIIKQETGSGFPSDPFDQLKKAVKAVFNSWNTRRAVVYRQSQGIPHYLGTAVNVQTMVFGNMGEDSATGVAFTRNPATGAKEVYGEYLINAQGEDVVAGIRTPRPLKELEGQMPDIYRELVMIFSRLERHYQDVQDIEFTVEKGTLYILQTRAGKRTGQAAVKVAVDMAEEGLISKEEAILRVEPSQVAQLLHNRIEPEYLDHAVTRGLPASPGAVMGKAIFDVDKAEHLGKAGEKVILVRPETTPDDIHGLVVSQGVLTSRGGMTSHAAIVARGMGKPCVVGAEDIKMEASAQRARVNGQVINDEDIITIDGGTGAVFLGEVPTVKPEITPEFQKLLIWVDVIRDLGVRANADTPEDARKARSYMAEGIGLCRTEHMFFAKDRLPVMQEMIMAEDPQERRQALEKLLPLQKEDFKAIFQAMQGWPVAIRLFDPPLHEFLPKAEDLLGEIARLESTDFGPELEEKENLLRKVRGLQEVNPMLGLRGCRLGIVYPEIYEMQTRAIFAAVVDLYKEGFIIIPEIMIPLVGTVEELKVLRERIDKIAREVMVEEDITLEYKVGTMMELPRACIIAGKIAEFADFMSFGTNDLTQTTFGYSRDDAEGKFLHIYHREGILENNPFEVLDQEGVGTLIDGAVAQARAKKEDIKIGICGEHGGEPSSVEFCYGIGLDYVSCSPFRVPIARIAAAQAKIKAGR
jgi:pyruvate,orthophosphate dikinase